MPSKTIAGALIGGALGAFGRKPVIPELPVLDTGEEQLASIRENRLALPELEKLAAETNRFNYEQITSMLEQAVPGFRAAITKAGEVAASLGRGEIPEDVTRAVLGSSAARSLGGGFAGSGLARNLTARDLGLTSLSLTGEGQNRLLGLGAFARSTIPTFDFTQAFIRPQEKLAFDWQQNIAQFQRNLLANQVAAAPDPRDVELAGALDNFFETWKNVGMGALGGWMGGLQGIGGTGASNAYTPSGREKTAAEKDAGGPFANRSGFGGGGGSWLNYGGSSGGGGAEGIDWNKIINDAISNAMKNIGK